MTKKALACFTWFPKPTYFTGGKPTKEKVEEETTLWYHSLDTEYHLWLTVRKSEVPYNKDDMTKGYGVFSKRKFYRNDIISIYLGEYVRDDSPNIYTLDQILPGGATKRIMVEGGFPKF